MDPTQQAHEFRNSVPASEVLAKIQGWKVSNVLNAVIDTSLKAQMCELMTFSFTTKSPGGGYILATVPSGERWHVTNVQLLMADGAAFPWAFIRLYPLSEGPVDGLGVNAKSNGALIIDRLVGWNGRSALIETPGLCLDQNDQLIMSFSAGAVAHLDSIGVTMHVWREKLA